MYVTEIDSFVQKFRQLWKAGVTAHLDIDTHAGKAWVGLRVQLGDPPGPVHHEVPRQQRGPAYQRRQERRQAARAAAESSSTADQSNSDVLPAAKANNASEVDDQTEKSEEDTSADQAGGTFSCDICDFKSNWANGLSVHITRKHPRMEQLDGTNSISDDLDDDDKYSKTVQYWKEGKIGTIFQTFLDVLDVIESSDLTEESKDLEKDKVLESRKIAFGKDFEHFPPWNSN